MPELQQSGGALSVIDKLVGSILAEGARNGSLSDSIGAGKALSIREMTQDELDARAVSRAPGATVVGAHMFIDDPRPSLADSEMLTNMLIKNPDGTPTGGFVMGPSNHPSMAGSTNEQIAQVAEFFADVPDEVKKTPLVDSSTKEVADAVPEADIVANYNGSNDAQKNAAEQLVKNGDVNGGVALKKAAKKKFARADHARVSMERHEWAYCCDETKSEYMELFATMDSGFVIKYTGTEDPLGTTYKGPGYWEWIRWEEFRKCVWIARRYRRLRSKCGGKEVWEAQGFATKLAAIQSDLKADAEYQSLRTTIIAGNTWSGV